MRLRRSLEKVLDLLRSSDDWTRYTYSQDADGNLTWPWEDDTQRLSLDGAIWKVVDDNEAPLVISYLGEWTYALTGFYELFFFNDAAGHEAVLKMLRLAINALPDAPDSRDRRRHTGRLLPRKKRHQNLQPSTPPRTIEEIKTTSPLFRND